jgi:hypothetical protein
MRDEIITLASLAHDGLTSSSVNNGFVELQYPENFEIKVRRYMSLAMLLDLVTTRQLFFSQCSTLDDWYESAWPNREFETQLRHCARLHPDWTEQRVRQACKERGQRIRENTYVSCWCAAEKELDAMWKLYCRPQEQGIAIQTSYRALHASITDDPSPVAPPCLVQYMDYENGIYHRPGMPDTLTDKSYLLPENDFLPVGFKREAFEFEHEVRLYILDFPVGVADPWDFPTAFPNESCNGKRVLVESSTLVREIVVSPYADRWFVNVVEEVLRHFMPSAHLQISTMSSRPLSETR